MHSFVAFIPLSTVAQTARLAEHGLLDSALKVESSQCKETNTKGRKSESKKKLFIFDVRYFD